MSETLKFGNGQWAVKEGSALAYNSENGNFKPLPFTFDRSTSATRVNKEGLIEVVPNNEPRIDFLNDSKGALLLEPARNNRLLQSNQFDTTWTLSAGIDLTSGQNGVGGSNNAWLLKRNSTGSRYVQQSLSLSSAQYSCSVYLKAESTNWALIWCYDGTTASETYFDLENGVVGNTGGSNFDNATIENVGNGWYRCTLIYTSATTLVRIYPANTNGNVSTGTDNGIYIQYAQLEQGSYPTSYIPTQGSIGTRVAESCVQTPPSGIIGQTEGTVYTELNMSNIGRNFIFSIDDGGASDFIILDTNSIGELDLQVRQSSGSITTIISGNDLIEGINKIAIRYKSGDYSLYLNGVLQGTSTSTLFPSGTISRVSVGAISSYGFLSNSVNDFKLYDTPLSNAELAELTKI